MLVGQAAILKRTEKEKVNMNESSKSIQFGHLVEKYGTAHTLITSTQFQPLGSSPLLSESIKNILGVDYRIKT